MAPEIVIVIGAVCLLLGFIVSALLFNSMVYYYKTQRDDAIKNVDKRATEIILSMDIEMFKVEKEMAEHKKRNKKND